VPIPVPIHSVLPCYFSARLLGRFTSRRAALAGGMSVRKTAAKFDVNPSTVQRIARPFVASVAGAAQANRCPARKGPLEGMLSSGRG